MTERNITSDNSNPYEARNTFWTELAINKFGTTLNFFSVISLGFLAFLLERNEMSDLFRINCNTSFDYKKLFIVLSLLACFLSIVCSSLAILSRLYDLRLTRHTIWTRYRFYKEKSKYLPDDYLPLSNSYQHLLLNFYSTIRRQKEYYINDNEIQDSEVLLPKFQALRLRNLNLGRFSYSMFGSQIVLILFSALLFFVANVI